MFTPRTCPAAMSGLGDKIAAAWRPAEPHFGPGLKRRDLVRGAPALSLAGRTASAASATAPHRIDVHFHMVPPQYLATSPPGGDVQRAFAQTAEASLREMDRNGVAVSMLSFPTPLFWLPGVEPGRRLARLCNDYYAG